MVRKEFSIAKLPGFSLIAVIVFVALYLPIMMLVIYSFNSGKSVAIWEGFSLQWYVKAWANEQVKEVTLRSVGLALSAATFSTIAVAFDVLPFICLPIKLKVSPCVLNTLKTVCVFHLPSDTFNICSLG